MLITDIRMPELTGVEVLRQAKQINPSIISIMMTAFASTDTAVEALRLGADDYVEKPSNAVNDCACACARSSSASACSRRTSC